MRCIAHILNLVVTDGLKKANESIRKFREVIRYIRISPNRLRKFRDISDLVGIESKFLLTLDVPTKWNSIYNMLSTACLYVTAFEKYEESEAAFILDLDDDILIFLTGNVLIKLFNC